MRLGLVADLACSKKAKETLNDIVKGIELREYPLEFDSTRNALNASLKVYDKAVQNVYRHRKALDQVASNKRAAAKEASRLWRGNRDKILDFLVEKEVPDNISKTMADRIYGNICAPGDRGAKLDLPTPKQGVADSAGVEAFAEPIVFHYDPKALEENLTEYEIKICKFYRDHESAAVTKMRELVQAMSSPATPALSAIGAIDVQPEAFDFFSGIASENAG